MKSEILAGIDVGSHALRMKIAEVNEKAEIKNLEMVRQPISLGSDTYAAGRVSFATVDRTCEILKAFRQLMKDYRVRTYRAVATSAIREAENRDYIIDQIKLKTGLDISVISNAEERSLTYKAIRENLPQVLEMRHEGVILVTVGSGSIEVSQFYQNQLIFSQNIKLGSLRLREVLAGLEGRTLNFPRIMKEFISANLDRLNIESEYCKNFIALGGEIRTIGKLCNRTGKFQQLKYIKKQDFLDLFGELVNKSPEDITREYDISPERANVLVPSMMLFRHFLEMTDVKGINAPLVSLRDGIISDLIDSRYDTKRKSDFREDIVSYARQVARKYQYDEAHALEVEEKSLLIFDELKCLHGLGFRERQLLQLACILHDTGKFINLNQHYLHSYNIILATEIIGISQPQLEIIANVARYHSQVVPRYNHENFRRLSEVDRVTVAKLAAIIRLADALDRTHRQKITDLKINLAEKEVVIRAESEQDTLVEEWTFATKAAFFREVFGVTPVLRIKRTLGL